jgi:hypothetical protein
MIGEHVTQGMQVRLKPRGPGRFFGASFLTVWLCGWAAGEIFVLTVLVLGAISLITGNPVGPMKDAPEPGPALIGGAFLLFWFAGWTVGGIMAIRQLLRMVWAEDRIVAAGHGLIIERWLGPFRSTKELPRDQLRRIYLLPRTNALTAETTTGSVEISSLGTPDDREQAVTVLSNYLGLESEPEASEPVSLPRSWAEVVAPEGDLVLVENPEQRRKYARIVSVLAVAAATLALLFVYKARSDLNLLPLTAMACAAAFALGLGANWLARGRMEWRIGSSMLVLRRRWGRRVRELFEARALELTVSSDSDNDDWYELEAIASDQVGVHSTRDSKKGRRKIDRAMHDPTEMQQLGRWLANRTGLPFTDRSTREESAAELARFKDQLSDKGMLGRWAVRLIEHAEARRR